MVSAHVSHIPTCIHTSMHTNIQSIERSKYSIYRILQKDNTDWGGVQVLVHQTRKFWKTWITKGLIRRLWSDSQTKGVSAEWCSGKNSRDASSKNQSRVLSGSLRGWMGSIFSLSITPFKSQILGTSLVVQWLGVHLPMQAPQTWSLIQEDPTSQGVNKPMCHSYWNPYALVPMLRNKRSTTTRIPRTTN